MLPQNMTLLAGEAKDPHKTIPKAINKGEKVIIAGLERRQ
jgi:amino acid permease